VYSYQDTIIHLCDILAGIGGCGVTILMFPILFFPFRVYIPGHYYSFVRHLGGDRWLRCDDSDVSDSSFEVYIKGGGGYWFYFANFLEYSSQISSYIILRFTRFFSP